LALEEGGGFYLRCNP
jgi:hypothetical protein